MKEFLNALHGNFSIIVTKKDGTYDNDNCIHYVIQTQDAKESLNALRKKHELANRTDLAIDLVSSEEEYYLTEDGDTKLAHYVFIGLKEI